jgi:hypothetical protein
MSNYRSEEARQLQQERRAADRERTIARHAGRTAKYAPTRGIAGAW